MRADIRKELDIRNGPDQLMFSVRACQSAHLELLTETRANETFFDVYIGGGGNTNSAIRVNASSGEIHGRINSKELDCKLYRTFWMSWNTHSTGYISIQVGRRHLGHDVFIEESFPTSSTFKISYIEIWSYRAPSHWVISQGRW